MEKPPLWTPWHPHGGLSGRLSRESVQTQRDESASLPGTTAREAARNGPATRALGRLSRRSGPDLAEEEVDRDNLPTTH